MAGVSTHMTTQRNPAFFNFAGGDGQVTVGEKKASMAGVAQRGTAGVTTGRDRCKRGKACGATCIAGNEDCIIDFPEPVQAEIRKMAQYVVKQREKQGRPLEAGSEEDIQIGKAVGLVGGQLTREGTYQRGTGKYKKEVTERTFDTTTRGQTRLLSPSEIRDLKANRDKLGNAEFDAKAMKALQGEVNSRGVTLDRKSLEMVYDSLPQSARTALMQSGNPGKGMWYGKDEKGNDVTNLNNGTRDRGLAVLDMYVRQGGRDAYGNSKRVMSPADFDVEHVRPASKGGLDHPSNWILARSGAQRQRANEELGKWIDRLPDPNDKAAMNKYYSDFAADSKKKAAAKAVAGAVNPRSLSDAELVKVSPKNLRYMFDRDSFFASGFYGTGSGTPRLTSTPPVPVSKAYALIRKHDDDAAKEIRSQTKQIWNKNWFEGGGSTAKMTNDMINLYRSRLPAEAFKAVEADLVKWQAKMLKDFPSGPPKVIGSDSPSAPPAQKTTTSGNKMTQKDAESAIDDLLKGL
jgi:hypothetical protein